IDTQGTHSSAGIPSLLNSPLSQNSVNGHAASSAPGMTPSSTTSTFLPFKFRLRRESVDWRRIGAVDVDLVVSQLDVDALQEHISTVTFCSLEGERCQRCQSPVDPALVKLLRLAQLTVEWLLHCQEFLTLNLRAVEEKLSAAGREHEQLLAQQKKQEEKVKALTAELKQRKKVIRTQQSLLAPRITSSHKCLHCEKSFLNSSFLQNHVQRRHPEEYEIRKSKQQSMHKDLLRELDRFKAEEMARMDRKIEDSRDGMRREMEFLYNRNIQALNVLKGSFLVLIHIYLHTTDLIFRVLQIRPRSSSLPSRASQGMSASAVRQPKTPQPAPRTKTTTQYKTSTPNTKAALKIRSTRTPPFSSEEDSEDDVTDEDEEQPLKHQQGKSPQPRLNQATPIQIRAGKASPVQARQAPAFSLQQSRVSVGSVTKTAVTKMENDYEEDDWSNVSELQEIDPRQLQSYKDQNGNVEKKNHGKGQNMEKQFAERAVKKPAGGVSILPEREDERSMMMNELCVWWQYTDLEESSEWMVSSLEDRQDVFKPAQGSGPMRKSLDSQSTSIWGTSTGKGPKSGLPEAGTGSTLKSSLYSLSDISDSEDIS
uniref:DAZ interacting zinc finger protein 1 n=1 Tax=Amphilophus citrinellus TaxID=61819 RepID=A0A3Q0SNZ6_AMPCI